MDKTDTINKTDTTDDRCLIWLAQSGDNDAMGKLIDKHYALIRSIVKRFLNRGTDKDDLLQIGVVGFIKCIRRFDLSYNVKLSTYAVPIIMGELKCFFRTDGLIKVSRSIKENYAAISKLMEANGGKMSLKSAAKELNISYDDAVIAVEASRGVESLDYKTDDDEKTTVMDKYICDENREEKIVNKIVVNQLIAELSEQGRKIITMRYFENKTQSVVASEMGISQVQVSRLEKKILSGMREKLKI